MLAISHIGNSHSQSVKQKDGLDLHNFGILDGGFCAETSFFFEFCHTRRRNASQFCDFSLGETGHLPAHVKVCKLNIHGYSFVLSRNKDIIYFTKSELQATI